MAQKASPYAIRVGYNQIWNNYFFSASKKEQINQIKRSKLIRDYLYHLFPDIAQLRTEQCQNNLFIYLHIPEINLVLGKDQENLEKIIKKINSLINDNKIVIRLNLIEVKKIYAHAQVIANLIAGQLKKRIRLAQIVRNLQSKLRTEKENKGIKIKVRGRLDESDNAQTKKIVEGKMKLSTIDSNIKVGRKEVTTSYGKIGIEILLYKGRFWQKNKTT